MDIYDGIIMSETLDISQNNTHNYTVTETHARELVLERYKENADLLESTVVGITLLSKTHSYRQEEKKIKFLFEVGVCK